MRTAQGAKGVTSGLQSTYENIMGMAKGGRIGYSVGGGRDARDFGKDTTKGDGNGLEEKRKDL